MATNLTVHEFGEFEGKPVQKFTIIEEGGIRVSLINYGAIITNLWVPDRHGTMADVVLGFETLEGYISSGRFYIGCICGRYANRIADARFSLNGNVYALSRNIEAGCLHGGYIGFDKKFWESEILPERNGVRFRYKSPDGDEGFPGNLDTVVTYRVADHALHIEYEAVSDKPTPVNLTSHSYFNLSGGQERGILSHNLKINGTQIVEVGKDYMPTGRLRDILNTPLDFTSLKKIGGDNSEPAAYDYSWVISPGTFRLKEAATLEDPNSGRSLTVLTTQPAVHFYSGHLLGGNIPGTKSGIIYGACAGLCLETQHFPDSPNHPGFPETIIMPGKTYSEETVFRFNGI
ncbi:MAG: aldose epimerase family protein [Chitinophagaceae bacterium]